MKSEDTDGAKRTVVTDEVKGCCLRDKEKVKPWVSPLLFYLVYKTNMQRYWLKKVIYLYSKSSMVCGASYGDRIVMKIK